MARQIGVGPQQQFVPATVMDGIKMGFEVHLIEVTLQQAAGNLPSKVWIDFNFAR